MQDQKKNLRVIRHLIQSVETALRFLGRTREAALLFKARQIITSVENDLDKSE